jgi:hypothetical protein
MMKPISLKVAVPNGLLFVKDSMIADVPNEDYGNAAPVWSIPTCLVVCCLIDCEGETDITVGAVTDILQQHKPVFDGILETPSRKLVLDLVSQEKVLEVGVPSPKNRVRVWTDGRHQCAETVVIGIG